jgi:hypothetical protein
MLTHTPRHLAVVVVMVLAGVPGAAAQTKRPDFSGVWQQDIEASKALTEKNGQPWRVAGAGSGSGAAVGAPPANATIMRPTTFITQNEREIILERRFEDEAIDRNVYKLDGSISVNASRNSSSRSTAAWKGNALVVSGTLRLDFSDGNARDAAGNPIPEIVRDFVTTRTLRPDGTMEIESRTTQNGVVRLSYTVLVRVKPMP